MIQRSAHSSNDISTRLNTREKVVCVDAEFGRDSENSADSSRHRHLARMQ